MKKWIAAEIVELNIAETSHHGGGGHGGNGMHDGGNIHGGGSIHEGGNIHHGGNTQPPTPDNNMRPPMPGDYEDDFVDDLS